MDEKALEYFYKERLDECIIEFLSEKHGIDYNTSMDIYYKSKLAEKIYEGRYGVQDVDYKVLVDILEETEPELFDRI
jgi:hypothetical protein